MALSTDPSKPSDQPLGLQRLSELDGLEVHSKIKLLWSGIGSEFEFRECSGQLLFYNHIDSKGFTGFGRSFNITLLDDNDVQVIQFRRPKNYWKCKIEVSIQDEVVSVVRQKCGLKLSLQVDDANGVPLYRVKGPWVQTGDFKFQITTMDEQPVCTITKQWPGWRKEFMNKEDNFTINFPRELDVKCKAACIGACVFIIHARRQQRRNR